VKKDLHYIYLPKSWNVTIVYLMKIVYHFCPHSFSLYAHMEENHMLLEQIITEFTFLYELYL